MIGLLKFLLRRVFFLLPIFCSTSGAVVSQFIKKKTPWLVMYVMRLHVLGNNIDGHESKPANCMFWILIYFHKSQSCILCNCIQNLKMFEIYHHVII